MGAYVHIQCIYSKHILSVYIASELEVNYKVIHCTGEHLSSSSDPACDHLCKGIPLRGKTLEGLDTWIPFFFFLINLLQHPLVLELPF
jgi:hypothetical protein